MSILKIDLNRQYRYNMNLKRDLLAVLLGIFSFFVCAAAPTASQIIAKASQRVIRAGSVTANFRFSGGGQTGAGTIKSSGKKFAIETSGMSSWYNGKDLWTYTASSKETTLVRPTASELAETNPLTYLSEASKSFTCSFGKGDSAAKRIVVLTPKSRKLGVQSVTLELEGKTLNPLKINIKGRDGSVSSVVISSFRLGKTLAGSNFEYPKNKYPKIKIIDLR